MIGTPWIVIAASIAAGASLFNIWQTSKLNENSRRNEAFAQIANIRLSWLSGLRDALSGLASYASVRRRRKGEKPDTESEVFLSGQKHIDQIKYLLNPADSDHDKILENISIIIDVVNNQKISNDEFREYKKNLLASFMVVSQKTEDEVERLLTIGVKK
ncbi:MAG: hypothetical protein AAGI14_05675 [Pseudomonadota bacterium]